MSKWSALVYGRTYEVDFRLIAMPKDFTKTDKDWAEKYILGTTKAPEKLPEYPRWSLFKNEKYCVIGVTAMARELVQEFQDENYENLTKDSQGRPLYVFVGYVANLEQEAGCPQIPTYLGSNIDLFKPLYNKYIRQCWSVKSYQEARFVPILAEYEELDYIASQTVADFDSDYFALNFKNTQVVCLWKDDEKERQNLWLSAAQNISTSSSVSLCLGLATQKDASKSPFLNVTASSVKEKESVPKWIQPSVEHKENQPIPPTQVKSQPLKMKQSIDLSKKAVELEPIEIVGGLIGGVTGFKIAGLFGCLTGIGIGWVGFGLLTNKGIGGTIRKQISGSLDETEKPRSRQRVTEQENTNYGFKPRSKPNQQQGVKNESQQDSDWF